MPKLKSYGVFISHAWAYSTDYYRLERMLNNAKHFKWRNCSVPQHDPLDTRTDAELEKALEDQIRPANVVVIISGMYVKYRPWIQKEIDIALAMHKPILALKPRGSQRIPIEIQAIDPSPKGWKTPTVVRAIRRAKRPRDGSITINASEVGTETAVVDQKEDGDTTCSFSELSALLDSNDSNVAALIARRAKAVTRRSGMSG